MITKVVHRPWGRDRTVSLLGAPIDGATAAVIKEHLHAQRIPVAVVVDGHRHVVHLWPWLRTTTAQEVTVLREFAAVTDYRLAWHPLAVTA